MLCGAFVGVNEQRLKRSYLQFCVQLSMSNFKRSNDAGEVV